MIDDSVCVDAVQTTLRRNHRLDKAFCAFSYSGPSTKVGRARRNGAVDVSYPSLLVDTLVEGRAYRRTSLCGL